MSEEPTDGPCYFCGESCDKYDYCFGCMTFVCDGCNVNYALMGTHYPEDHAIEPDDDDFDWGW